MTISSSAQLPPMTLLQAPTQAAGDMDMDPVIFGVANPNGEQKKLMQAAKQLEAIFASQLFAEIGKKLPGTSTEGAQGEIFGQLYSETLSTNMANQGALGLAKMIYRDMAAQLPSPPPAENTFTETKTCSATQVGTPLATNP